MRREIDLDEFCRFAKSYLSEAFPNPQRIGSPADSALTDWGVRSAFSYNALSRKSRWPRTVKPFVLVPRQESNS
jgi:hypothetical protein